MIKKLERRLILVATAVLAAVLIVTLTVVNIINYAHITDTADRTLTYIADRKSVVEGKGVDLGGRRIIKKKKCKQDGDDR